MGVVYKLNEEVIHFLLQQKQNDPSLSCRQLSEMASAKFQIKISKSSVNTVLKGNKLSSSVGRRSGKEPKRKKFQIPQQRKEQISDSLSRHGLTGKKAEAAVTQPKQPEKNQKQKAGAPIPEQSLKEKAASVLREESKEAPEIHQQEFFKKVKQLKAQHQAASSPVRTGMGFIFLKAAEWQISKDSLPGKVLRKYCKGAVPDDFDTTCGALACLSLLGEKTLSNVSSYSDHALWQMQGFTSPLSSSVLSSWAESFQFSKEAVFEYASEQQQASLKGGCIKLFLNDQTVLALDPRMTSLWNQKVPRPLAWPIHKVLTVLSNHLISNNQALQLYAAPGQQGIDEEFFDLVRVFENLEEKAIERIAVFDEEGEKIAEFSTIPMKRRNFVVGIWPAQKEFQEFIKAAKWASKKPFYQQGFERIVYYTETKSNLLGKRLGINIEEYKILTLWEHEENGGSAQKEPFLVLLTNQGDGSSAEDILGHFLNRWPNLKQGQIPVSLDEGMAKGPATSASGDEVEPIDGATNLDEISNFWGILENFGYVLHKYCKEHFFPSNWEHMEFEDFLTSVYGLPGCIYESKNVLEVTLIPPQTPFPEALILAVEKLNDDYVIDSLGRRVVVNIRSA